MCITSERQEADGRAHAMTKFELRTSLERLDQGMMRERYGSSVMFFIRFRSMTRFGLK
jgi:hypothetical protein